MKIICELHCRNFKKLIIAERPRLDEKITDEFVLFDIKLITSYGYKCNEAFPNGKSYKKQPDLLINVVPVNHHDNETLLKNGWKKKDE